MLFFFTFDPKTRWKSWHFFCYLLKSVNCCTIFQSPNDKQFSRSSVLMKSIVSLSITYIFWAEFRIVRSRGNKPWVLGEIFLVLFLIYFRSGWQRNSFWFAWKQWKVHICSASGWCLQVLFFKSGKDFSPKSYWYVRKIHFFKLFVLVDFLDLNLGRF